MRGEWGNVSIIIVDSCRRDDRLCSEGREISSFARNFAEVGLPFWEYCCRNKLYNFRFGNIEMRVFAVNGFVPRG